MKLVKFPLYIWCSGTTDRSNLVCMQYSIWVHVLEHIQYMFFSLFAGILRPLNVLASSTYRNYAKNACLNSALCAIHFRHIQTPAISSAPGLVTSIRNLTHGQTATVLNR